MDQLTLGPTTARLTVRTGVEGKAARLGHDLVLVLDDWTATASLASGVPVSASLTAAVHSLRVESGSGGAKPLSDKDRTTIRKNALGGLAADRHPTITFSADAGAEVPGGWALTGPLSIAGSGQLVVVEVLVAEDAGGWSLAARVPVQQTAFGVEPYSTMLGALRLRDEVVVAFDAVVPQPPG